MEENTALPNFENFLIDNGIKHETSVPRCPEQNGTAERLNRTLLESVKALLADSGLEKKFWAEALNTANYLRNRSATSSLGIFTPFEVYKGFKPNVGHLRRFGCTAYVHIRKEKRDKLDGKSLKCIFFGYSETSKGYRFYNIETDKVFIERTAIFF